MLEPGVLPVREIRPKTKRMLSGAAPEKAIIQTRRLIHQKAVASSYPGRCAKGLRTHWDVTVHK